MYILFEAQIKRIHLLNICDCGVSPVWGCWEDIAPIEKKSQKPPKDLKSEIVLKILRLKCQ